MQSFRDVADRVWIIDLNIRTVRDIRRRMAARADDFGGVDFLDYATLLFSLNDIMFGADLLALILQEQIEAAGLDEKSFGAGLKGKPLFDGLEALTAEYIDFFPDPAAVEKMKTVVEKNREARLRIAEAIAATATEKIEEAVASVEQRLGVSSSERSGSAADPSPDAPS